MADQNDVRKSSGVRMVPGSDLAKPEPGNAPGFSLTLGVEEELFLVDRKSREPLVDPDIRIFETCERTCGPHKVVRELIRSQVETNTRVCASIDELRTALQETRRIVIRAAAEYGASVLAASTHPLARWQDMAITPKERYRRFVDVFQEVLRRFIIGGMHVHAGFGDADSRIRVMTGMRRYLPLLHALSCSSPFNSRHNTGYKSFRLNLVGGLPRTGIPAPLSSWQDYENLLAEYRDRQFANDGSELWWDIRPSHSFPTVELRICDTCSRVEESLSVTALYASLVRYLWRRNLDGELPEEPLTEMIQEDRWVAQRYGVFSFFGDRSSGTGRIDIQDYLEETLEEVRDDARELGCESEVRGTLEIVRSGSSADRQVDLYRLRRLEGDTHEEALVRVVDLLLAETREDVPV
ncbi:MAG: YbdK family carboxylate-amine ligase [Paracoccaceae bacterium]|nr:YbdK family carboxylate-amine ligase [Paracoccaceae bacterium]